MDNHQLVNQDSGNTEYYTPPKIIEAAKLVMGRIDFDPASSIIANKIIGAKKIFTVNDNGLIQRWHGRAWMNHPFQKGKNHLWINKLISEFKCGNVEMAMCITYAATSEKWFQPLLDYPMCFLCPRTNYLLPDGSVKMGVTKGSVVTFLLPDSLHGYLGGFMKVFRELGKIKV